VKALASSCSTIITMLPATQHVAGKRYACDLHYVGIFIAYMVIRHEIQEF
jgi:hypothetical protein